MARPIDLAAEVPALSTPALLEPGIFGVFRPVLLLPEGILTQLTRAQLGSILAHEISHVRRRDNLTFAVHMVVEVLFWFYLPVWWIGRRLIEERERACDEAVVQAGGEAATYAQGILNVCEFCLESPLECAAGVTGSDLKKRIVRIMAGCGVRKLDLSRKLLLTLAGSLAVSLPLVLGVVHATQTHAQDAKESAANLPRYEVASIKPHKSEENMMRTGFRITPDGISVFGASLSMLVSQAFELPENRILNEPAWAKSDRFDIEAKVESAEAPRLEKLTREQRMAMMLPLLEDRFGLKFHHETKVMNVYTLVVARGGPKLQTEKLDEEFGGGRSSVKGDEKPDAAWPSPGAGSNAAVARPDGSGKPGDGGGAAMPPKGAMIMQMSTQGMTMTGRGLTTDQLAEMIERALGSTVVNKTGLDGKYDYQLSFALAMGGMPPSLPPVEGPSSGEAVAASTGAPSIFTAVQEQLGLKLVARKEPVDVIVIEQIAQPSPN